MGRSRVTRWFAVGNIHGSRVGRYMEMFTIERSRKHDGHVRHKRGKSTAQTLRSACSTMEVALSGIYTIFVTTTLVNATSSGFSSSPALIKHVVYCQEAALNANATVGGVDYPLLATLLCIFFSSGSVSLARVTPLFLAVTGFLSCCLTFSILTRKLWLSTLHHKRFRTRFCQ